MLFKGFFCFALLFPEENLLHRASPATTHHAYLPCRTTHPTRHVNEAFTISVVRTRTVTFLEFFWNVYSVLKSIITTFLGLPGVSTVLSMTGADQATNIPGFDFALEFGERLLSMLILVGSKPG